jgi:hypothetical protein
MVTAVLGFGRKRNLDLDTIGDFGIDVVRGDSSIRQDDESDSTLARGRAYVAGCPRRVRAYIAVACGLTLGLPAGGCAFGPVALEKTHWRYNEAIQRVNEEQLLRNIVRMRYNEPPSELNVSSIAAQYELDGAAEARPFFLSPNPSNSNVIFKTFTSILPDVSISGANRPTITLVPANTGDAVQRFLTPITPETLVFLFQTSWPVSTVTRLWVERINGVPNAASASGPPPHEMPDFARFRRIAEILQSVRYQKFGTIHPEEDFVEIGGPLPAESVNALAMVEAAKNGLEYRLSDDGKSWSLIRKQRRLVIEVTPAARRHPEMIELETLLNLKPGLARYDIDVAQGILPDPLLFPSAPRTDLAISTRSNEQVFFFLANGVEVPPEHLATQVASTPIGPDGTPFDSRAVTDDLFTVHACTGHKPPKNAYVAVKHRGYWYYIDDRDQTSKATLALVLQVSRLDFARQQPAAPFLTLPVGR